MLDLNRATYGDLLNLDGLGPVLVTNILKQREIKPFKRVADLKDVPGIGRVTFGKIVSRLMVK